MAFFGATIERIEKAWKHPDADRLDLCRIEGADFQFVAGRDNWQAGDLCIYFPIDSLIPLWVQQELGVEGKLSGKNQNRVKTVRLRGEISQGLVGSPEIVRKVNADFEVVHGADVTELLGVEKYEPPVVQHKNVIARPLPTGVKFYDIEGCDRYTAVLQHIIENDIRVWVSEKLEGSHFVITINPDNEIKICTRRQHVEEKPGEEPHLWCEVSRRMDLHTKIRQIKEKLGASIVSLHGEMIGPTIQKNIYRLPRNKVVFFDIRADEMWIDVPSKLDTFSQFGLEAAPTLGHDVLLPEWLEGKTVKEASDGQSKIAPTRREGIVITPMAEKRHPTVGRLILKQRGPIYLSKSDA